MLMMLGLSVRLLPLGTEKPTALLHATLLNASDAGQGTISHHRNHLSVAPTHSRGRLAAQPDRTAALQRSEAGARDCNRRSRTSRGRADRRCMRQIYVQ